MTPSDIGKAVKKRFDRLWAKDGNWRSTWQELADYVLPRISNIIAKTTPGEKLTTKLYDSEAVKANNDLASALAGSMTSPVIRWFSLVARDARVNDMYDVRLWLDEVETALYFAIQQSNFSSQIAEFFTLLPCFGTAGMQIEEKQGTKPGFRGLQFKTLSPGSYVIAEDAEGNVNTVITKFELSLSAAASVFGAENLSEKLRDKLAADSDQMVTFLHAVYPDDNPDPRVGKTVKSCYVEYDTQHAVAEDGFFEFPYIVVRWAKDGSEVWGRGPGFIALPDIKTLNTAVRLRLKSWAKQVDPPMMMLDDGVIGQPRSTPGALNIVRAKDALTPMENGARVDFAIQQEDRLSMKIRNVFYADRVNLPTKQYMTAYEVQALREQMQTLLGPTTPRIEYEGLSRILARVFGIMLRAGAIPPPPAAILQLGTPVDIRYEGPLARAQRGGDTVAIQTVLQTTAPILQLDPSVADNFDFDEIVRQVGRTAGIPAKVLRDADQVAQIRQSRAEAQAQAQQQQQQMDESQIARNLTPAVKAAQANQEETPPIGSPPQ